MWQASSQLLLVALPASRYEDDANVPIIKENHLLMRIRHIEETIGEIRRSVWGIDGNKLSLSQVSILQG